MEVTVPDDLVTVIQRLVQAGEYPDVQSAAVDLIRAGLRARETPRGPIRPITPRELPPSERPIEPQPGDVNWIE